MEDSDSSLNNITPTSMDLGDMTRWLINASSYDPRVVAEDPSQAAEQSTYNVAFFHSTFRSISIGIEDYTGLVNFDSDEVQDIGHGTNYEVFSSKLTVRHASQWRKEFGVAVAIKRIRVEVEIGAEPVPKSQEHEILRSLLREVYVMRHLRQDPHILNILGFGRDLHQYQGFSLCHKYTPFLVVELATAGNLAQFLDIVRLEASADFKKHLSLAHKRHPFAQRRDMMIEVARGIHSLHRHAIFHTDIKPENVLVTGCEAEGYHAKLGDFGSSLITLNHTDERFPLGRDIGGTYHYQPPELDASVITTCSDRQLRQVDIYAFGICLYETLVSAKCSEAWLLAGRNGSKLVSPVLNEFMESDTSTASMYTMFAQALQSCIAAKEERPSDIAVVLHMLDQTDSLASSVSDSLAVAVNDDLPVPELPVLGLPIFLFNETRYLIANHLEMFIIALLPLPSIAAAGLEWSWLTELFQTIQNQLTHSPYAAELHLVSGLCYAHGFGVSFDPNKACDQILQAARGGNLTAKFIYRRMHNALFSIDTDQHDMDYFPTPRLPADALKDIDLDLYCILDRIERDGGDDYLAKTFPIVQRMRWKSLLGEQFLSSESAEESLNHSIDWNEDRISELLMLRIDQINENGDLLPFGRPYTLGLYLALTLLLSPSEHSKLFTKAWSVLRGFIPDLDVHLDCVPESMSPLELACRLGHTFAAKAFLEAGASPWYTSSEGTIPLHFLFAFPDEDIEEMSSLLSKGLDPEEHYQTTTDLYIVEQLLRLEGNPLRFALSMGSAIATNALWQRPSFQPWYAMSHAKLFLLGMESMAPPGWELPEPVSKICMQISGGVEILRDLQLIDDEDSHEELPPLALAAVLFLTHWLWTLSRPKHMVQYGERFAKVLGNRVALALQYVMRHGSLTQVDSISTLGLLCDRDSIYAWKTAFQLVCPDDILDRVHADAFRTAVLFHWQSPRQRTHIDQFMSRDQDPSEVLLGLVATCNCCDLLAFQRILELAQEYNIDWQGGAGPVGLYIHIALSSTRPAEFLNLYLEHASRYPKESCSWFGKLLPNGIVNVTNLPFTADMLSNIDAVLIFVEKGLMDYGGTWLHGPHVVNILHFACLNDRFAEPLSAFLDRLPTHQAMTLLTERSRPGDLTPIDVAIVLGSCECVRRIIRFLNDSNSSTILTMETIGRSRKLLQLFRSALPYFPYLSIVVGVGFPAGCTWYDEVKPPRAMTAMLTAVKSIEPNRPEVSQWENELAQAEVYSMDFVTNTRSKEEDETLDMDYNLLLAGTCNLVWLGGHVNSIRDLPRKPKFWATVASTSALFWMWCRLGR